MGPRSELENRDGVAAYGEYEDLLADSDVDAVVICTPTHLHEQLAIAALSAGKHVLVERPVALTAEATANVISAARDAGRCLMVGLSHRFRPDAGALAAFVAGGELGSVFAVGGSSLTRRMPFGRITWRQQLDQAGGGALMDLGVQALDLGFWLVGYPKITRVSAVMRMGEAGVEDSATVLAVSENGIAFNIDVSWSLFADADQHFARVMGTAGSGSLPPLQVHKQLAGRPMDVTPRQPKPRGGENLFTNAYRRLLDEYVRGISGHSEIPLPVEQIELMRVIEAAYRSAREQCEVAL
ncbi:MAG: Gfo/Idh/MocA family oxidoreductase [Gemmatimonadetes bacterium]|nr:Gfo/Idh/MocA family oxidoreductase [Gemmatimonadota bacterium]